MKDYPFLYGYIKGALRALIENSNLTSKEMREFIENLLTDIEK